MEQEAMHAASAPAAPEPRESSSPEDNGSQAGGEHLRTGSDGDAAAERGGAGRRRLFSLTSQRRRPAAPEHGTRGNGADADAGNGRPAGERPGSPDARRADSRRIGSRGGSRPDGASALEAARALLAGIDALAEEAQEPSAAEPRGAAPDATVPADRPDGTSASRPTQDRAAAARPTEPRRPSRPIYTLQQVHEMTGIPYPKLALYAVSEASRIPSLGERHAPAYPFESIQAFCRLHAERTPGWEIPDLTPPDDEISLRLEALERTQQQLEAVLQAVLAELAEPLVGTSA